MVFEGYTLVLRLKALQSTSNSHFVGLRYWKGSHSRSTVMNHMFFFLGLFCKEIKEIIHWLLETNWKNWMICQLEVQSEVDKLIVFVRQVSKGYRHYHSWNPPARAHIGVLHPMQQQLHPEAKMVIRNSTDSSEFREPMVGLTWMKQFSLSTINSNRNDSFYSPWAAAACHQRLLPLLPGVAQHSQRRCHCFRRRSTWQLRDGKLQKA